MMLMAMLTKLMHITIQLHQQKMKTKKKIKTNVKKKKLIQKPTKKYNKKGITISIKV